MTKSTRSESARNHTPRLARLEGFLKQPPSKLEEQGFVEAELSEMPNRPTKKIYSLTRSGSRTLDQWLEEPPAPVSFKNELFVKLFCMERLPTDVIVARLEERQADLEAMAQSLRDRLIDARRTAPDQLGYLLTLEAALSTVEEQASWCTGTAAELREAATVAAVARA